MINSLSINAGALDMLLKVIPDAKNVAEGGLAVSECMTFSNLSGGNEGEFIIDNIDR